MKLVRSGHQYDSQAGSANQRPSPGPFRQAVRPHGPTPARASSAVVLAGELSMQPVS